MGLTQTKNDLDAEVNKFQPSPAISLTVKEIVQGSKNEQEYLDIDLLDPSKVVIYERWIPDEEHEHELLEQVVGHLSLTDETKFHKYCGFNKFSVETYDLPSNDQGWKDIVEVIKEEYEHDDREETVIEQYIENAIKRKRKWIKTSICDPTATLFQPKDINPIDEVMKTDNFTMYRTLDNYGIGFIVLVDKAFDLNIESSNKEAKEHTSKEVYVFGRTKDVVTEEYDDDGIIIFDTLIEKYEPLEIFIGKSTLNEMTEFSGGHGSKWDGNSILLRLNNTETNSIACNAACDGITENNKFRYVQIGCDVVEFVINEQIVKYVSSVGNNCVPYPYAESKNWCYCITGHTKTAITDHVDREKRGYTDYLNTATYESFPVKIIAKRGIENYRSEKPCKTDRHPLCRFIGNDEEPIKCQMMQNTCDDNSLEAVQHINNVLNSQDKFTSLSKSNDLNT